MIRYNAVSARTKSFIQLLITSVTFKISFLQSYYRINDLMWQDGLLIDFLQKKVVDKWIRRFLVYSSYLFNERVVFEFVVRFYIDFIVWPSTTASVFEFSNVSLTLIGLLSPTLALILIFNLNYLFILCL